MKTALVLIAHGSRQAEANADLHQMAATLQQNELAVCVEPAFLELVEPTIAQAAQRCLAHGAERVILLPYFLSAGRHAREDLEQHRRRLADRYTPVPFLLAEPLGPHPLLAEILTQRVREVIAR